MNNFIKINNYTIVNGEDIEVITINYMEESRIELQLIKKDGKSYYIQEPMLILTSFDKITLDHINPRLYNCLIDSNLKKLFNECKRLYLNFKHKEGQEELNRLYDLWADEKNVKFRTYHRKIRRYEKLLKKFGTFSKILNKNKYKEINRRIFNTRKMVMDLDKYIDNSDLYLNYKTKRDSFDTLTEEDLNNPKYLEIYNDLNKNYFIPIKG